MESRIALGRMVSVETKVTMNKVTDSFLSDTTEPELWGTGLPLTLLLIIVYEIVSIRRVRTVYDAHAYGKASGIHR